MAPGSYPLMCQTDLESTALVEEEQGRLHSSLGGLDDYPTTLQHQSTQPLAASSTRAG